MCDIPDCPNDSVDKAEKSVNNVRCRTSLRIPVAIAAANAATPPLRSRTSLGHRNGQHEDINLNKKQMEKIITPNLIEALIH